MSDLARYFEENPGRLLHKWEHYFEIYERHFARYRDKPIHLLEFGVYHGGSLQMWQHYFGPQARIYGVDINPQCAALADEQTIIFIGDQGDPKFLRRLRDELPRLDIVIDDGGHFAKQQAATFEVLFDHIADDGVYLCEDIHTSYLRGYGGGLHRRGTFVEYSKRWIDELHGWYDGREVSSFARTTAGVHYYSGIVVVEKYPQHARQHRKTGTPTFPPERISRDPLWVRLPRYGWRVLRSYFPVKTGV